MTITEARKELRRVGVARASGDALRLAYADLIISRKGIHRRETGKIYVWIQEQAYNDQEIVEMARVLLRDPVKAYHILLDEFVSNRSKTLHGGPDLD